MFGHLAEVGGFIRLEVLPMRIPAVLGGSAPGYGTHLCDDYPLIAVRSGRTPMMFMTRVRL